MFLLKLQKKNSKEYMMIFGYFPQEQKRESEVIEQQGLKWRT